MVKENESTSSNEFLLLMELFQPNPESCNSDANLLNALEHTIQEAWAIAMELIQNGEVFVFLTGGNEKLLIDNIKNRIFADKYLVAKGLNCILQDYYNE